MSDLVDFLRARIDEDAALANDAKNDLDGVWTHVKTKGGRDKVVDSLGYSLTEFDDVESEPWWTNPHIARHDPARVLREVEAKRQLVCEISTLTEFDWGEPDGSMRSDYVEAFRRVLRIHALPYADHPDYREEWRP